MSEANPNGAVRALCGRSYSIRGRRVCLNMGVICACDILGVNAGDLRKVEPVAALFCIGGMRGADIARLLTGSNAEILAEIVGKTKDIFANTDVLTAAVRSAAEMVTDYTKSFCSYENRIAKRNGINNLTASGIGMTCTLAGLALRKFGMTWEQFLETPATRINVLCAAECEANGLTGKNTFYNREALETLGPIVRELQKKADEEYAAEQAAKAPGKPEKAPDSADADKLSQDEEEPQDGPPAGAEESK